MTGTDLVSGRKKKGWNQLHAAARLGVSQPYLSLLEKGERPPTEALARKAAKLYDLPPVVVPLRSSSHDVESADEDQLAAELAALGYPGLSHLKKSRRVKTRHQKNPAEVLASALRADNLDSRLTEALPWVLLKYPDLDWPWLVSAAKLNDFQNRLGFLTGVARRLAERHNDRDKAASLAQQESVVERSRLVREDTLCHSSLTNTERLWLRKHRPDEAKHWNLLTDLSPEHLSYAE